MFEQTFVQGAGEVRKPWPVMASLTGQLILVGSRRHHPADADGAHRVGAAGDSL